MKYEGAIAGGLLVAGIGAATFFMDGTKPDFVRMPGGSEACTYHAGPKDSEMIEEQTQEGRAILRRILDLDKKCEFVTLVLPDGTRQQLVLGVKGRKPGEKGPTSTGWTPN